MFTTEQQDNLLKENKNDYFEAIAHKLLTPLTIIKKGVQILYDQAAGPINADQKDFLETILGSVHRLNLFITTLLDYQLLQSDHYKLKPNPCAISTLIQELKDEFMLIAENKGMKFILELDEGLPETKLDKERITQVLRHLVNNAFIFSDQGWVLIKTSQVGEFIRVEVRDEGEGIKQEDLPKLFNQFNPIKNLPQKNAAGTGLGLLISKKIIDLHKGLIGAESTFGKGSTFYFTLPLQ